VALTWPQNQAEPTIEHYRNAFEPPDRCVTHHSLAGARLCPKRESGILLT
jgi:hypothetical protein